MSVIPLFHHLHPFVPQAEVVVLVVAHLLQLESFIDLAMQISLIQLVIRLL